MLNDPIIIGAGYLLSRQRWAVLAVALAALAGQGALSETMRALSRVAALSPAPRRIAFVIAGTGWALLMALPGAVTHLSVRPLMLGLSGGAGAAVIAIGLAAISRAAFAPRLVLLILWYGYFSTGGRRGWIVGPRRLRVPTW